MPLTEVIKNTYLSLSPALEAKIVSAVANNTIGHLSLDSTLTTNTPSHSSSNSTAMSLTETMIRPDIIKDTHSSRQVLDNIAKLKTIFADESFSKALSQLDAPSLLPNPSSFMDEPNGLTEAPVTGATRLKHMLNNTNDLIICPGVYDGLSARAAMEVGFDALYMVSLSVSNNVRNVVLKTNADWSRNHGLSTRHGGSCHRSTPRYEGACRDDCQPRPQRPASHCRHGHWVRW